MRVRSCTCVLPQPLLLQKMHSPLLQVRDDDVVMIGWAEKILTHIIMSVTT